MEHKTYLSQQHIADLLNKSISTVSRQAANEGWPFKKVQVQGGFRCEYTLADLPDEIKLLYNKVNSENLPVTSNQETLPSLPQEQKNKAAAKADLLRLYLNSIKNAGWGNKTKVRKSFMRAYNSGIAYPKLFKLIGKTHWKTIEGWKRTVRESGDTFSLADRRGYARKGRCLLSEEQEKVILRCVLNPNALSIAEAIRLAKSVMETKGISNGYSEATYRRWIYEWRDHNHHVWGFLRYGRKYWNENCAKYLDRDYSVLNVGDILVADGHVLNFEILNPWTGKPKRMTLILWLDMKSSFPLGWEIMPTENTQAIASALRRAILRLGKYPQVAYLDNGKAFASRFFNGVDLEQEGFSGLFDRLGIETIFAWPYHAQSKTVERFFGSFSELERLCPTYSGTSIEKKPPRMMRGEKLHRKVYKKATGGKHLTMEQAHRAIAAWFDEYTRRPQRGHLQGKSPLQVFMEGRGPGLDAAKLRYLMMGFDIKSIRRNRIRFLNQDYEADELYGRKHKVTIRYDLQDRSSIWVFEPEGRFLCEAKPPEKLHPAASVLGTDEDKQKLREHIEKKRQQEKEASALARQFLEEEILPEHRRQLESIGALGHTDNPKVKKLPTKLSKSEEESILADVKAYQKKHDQNEDQNHWIGLEDMPERDRYEKILEAEIRGIMVPKQYASFAKYYEQTEEYARHRGYWEDFEISTAMMYQANEKAVR